MPSSQHSVRTHLHSNKGRVICANNNNDNNDNNNNNSNNNNLLLIRGKLTSEYDQMRLTTKSIPNNYNKKYLL